MSVKNYKDTYQEYTIDITSENDSIIPVIIEKPENEYKLSKHFLNNSQIDQINEYLGKNIPNDNYDSTSVSFGVAAISLISTILINSFFLYANKFIFSEKTYNIILKTN